MKKDNHDKAEVLRHSLSHLMATAVLELYPDVKFAIGPAIEAGWYYDFDFGENKVGEDDLGQIEKKMKHMAKQGLVFERREMDIDEAIAKEKKAGQPYKEELIKDLKSEGETKVSYYKLGNFEDLCRGPHIESTKEIKPGSFKLNKLAGAYWRGSERNKMLTRIYGLGFETKEELAAHLEMLKEAEKRNHVKLGRELDLFSMHEEGPGFAFFHPKGMIVWHELMKYWKEEHDREHYDEIKTPIILRQELWEMSGHWDHYKENMYFTKIDDENFAVKPMNCPGGIIYYKSNKHSYRELPLRIAEVGLVHRHELSGTLNGLLRVRSFHQDDAHLYCMPEQIKDEVIKIANLIDRVYSTFGLDYFMELSTRPEKSIGDDKTWEVAENSLRGALKDINKEYKLNPGDGAFYGPKIDFHVKDALGRTWQCGTIQLDFAMPERFDLKYMGADGQEHRPVMLHRVIYGAIERFFGILLEHFGGNFPLWLSPTQVRIVTVGEDHIEFSRKLGQEFIDAGIRAEVDDANETVGNKIRKATKDKVPYMLVIGDKEMNSADLAVRERGSDKLDNIGKKEFIKLLQDKISSRSLD